jgi:hypothetical protein
MSGLLQRAAAHDEGATVFAYRVENPKAYGVVERDASGRAISMEEKTARPRSKDALTGTQADTANHGRRLVVPRALCTWPGGAAEAPRGAPSACLANAGLTPASA